MEASKSMKTLKLVTLVCVGLMVISLITAVESGQATPGYNTNMAAAALAGEMPTAPSQL